MVHFVVFFVHITDLVLKEILAQIVCTLVSPHTLQFQFFNQREISGAIGSAGASHSRPVEGLYVSKTTSYSPKTINSVIASADSTF